MQNTNSKINSRESEKRISQYFERTVLEGHTLNELGTLLQTEQQFSASSILQRGWTGIVAQNGGELDDEIELITNYAHSKGISTLYATSKFELDHAQNDTVLLARIPQFTTDDLFALQIGDWMYSPIADELIERDAWWRTWRSAIYFTLPMQFALVRLREIEGSTTIVGPPDLTHLIKTQSQHGLYEWQDWP